MLKFCSECGKELGSNVKKCPHCGKDFRNWFMRCKFTIIGYTFACCFLTGVVIVAISSPVPNETTIPLNYNYEIPIQTPTPKPIDKRAEAEKVYFAFSSVINSYLDIANRYQKVLNGLTSESVSEVETYTKVDKLEAEIDILTKTANTFLDVPSKYLYEKNQIISSHVSLKASMQTLKDYLDNHKVSAVSNVTKYTQDAAQKFQNAIDGVLQKVTEDGYTPPKPAN